MHYRLANFAALVATAVASLANVHAQQATPASAHPEEIRPALARIHGRQHLLARDKWQMAGRRLPGENSATLRARAFQQKLQMRAAKANSSSAGAWVSLGPMPLPSDASGTGLEEYNFVSGRATAVAIDPNDASGNTVFVGGAYGGVWKSSNAGALSQIPSSVTWLPLTDAQATLAIGSIAVQPQTSNPNPANSVVLAGTGETDSSTDSYYGLGLLRSANGGQTWTLISQDISGTHSFAGLGFSQIAFSAANPNLVVAGAGAASQGVLEGLEDPVGSNRGLYYSTDAGTTWQMASVSDAGVSISPDSVTAVAYNSAASTFYAAVRFHGFYSSPDAVHWTRLATQPGAGLATTTCPSVAASPSICPIYRGEIAIVPGRAGAAGLGEMYVWYVDASDADQGIWSSADGGATWSQINDSGITNCGDAFGGCGTENGAFNLTLAAVPDGAGTDLYAGAVNLYKCQITSASSACNGTGANAFLNLTHAYGCSDIARVHPGQHAISFDATSGTSLLYFANDGGIYRSLDGYTGLTTGACGQTNQFDSLNQTLGPLTQFVSLSESSSDANLIFGGTQDNGAPATASSQTGGDWVNVDAADNGFTAINPINEDEWFVSTPPDSISGVNLFRCANGVNCHTLDFQNDEIVDSSSVEGDTGGFYLPFLLDPQNSGVLILGTCRIWRGPATGGSFTLLSPDFETGGSGSCSGDEVNLVRSLAAGGLQDSNGYSQSIYAGTNGQGPLVSTTPNGGRVWITTNAGSGPLAWTDVTQSINPQAFPVSSIALDAADPLGKTAYVTIMGFHTSHLWKTSDAGASWTDFTANLPDAPANAVIVDSGNSLANGTVYIGTDVGVFSSSTGSADWSEVGSAPGESGFLPNTAVTSLQIFNSGGVKQLRAATYGRGIWEWNLVASADFQINFSSGALTVFPSQTANFNGTIAAVNGYSSTVNFSCAMGSTNPPQSCSPTPASTIPASGGTALTVSAKGAVGDYQFDLKGAGTDPTSTTHTFPLTLHIVDFALGTLSPGSISVNPGSTSSPVSFQVSALGSFTGSVALSCSNLPAGASCQFQPASASPTQGNPVTVTLTIAVPSATALGSYGVSISAGTAGEPAKAQRLTLVVGAFPDYSLSIANPSLSATVNTTATFNGALTAIDNYDSSVALSCGAGAPPACTVSPASATPSSAGSTFTVSVSSNLAQTYNFDVVGVGSDSGAITHSTPVSFTATSQNFDFTLGITPQSATLQAGQSANFSLAVNPNTGSFPDSVTFSCSGLPASSACTFNPSQINSGSGNSQATLTLSTTGQSGSGGTPTGTYTITVTATSGSVAHSAQLTLTVQPQAFDFTLVVSPTSATIQAGQSAAFSASVDPNTGSFPSAVSFSCSGLPALSTCKFNPNGVGAGSGNSTVTLNVNTTGPSTSDSGVVPGTPAGTYTITVTATSGSVAHNAQFTLTITGTSQSFDFNIGVSPATATIAAGQTLTLTATVTSTTGSFPGTVSFSCSSLPQLTSCSFQPPQSSSEGATESSTLTISTTAAVAASMVGLGPLLPLIPSIAFILARRQKRQRTVHVLVLAALLALVLSSLSCGGGLQGNGGAGGSGSPGTPPGTYNIMVTAKSGSQTHNATVVLTVTGS